jgi:hypothetical protein
MPTNTYKILGQINPAVSTEEVLYTVPASTSAVCSSIVVCNWGISDSAFTISLSQNLVATDPKDYLYYDVAIAGNDTFIATIGITLAADWDIRVYSSVNGKLSYTVFGTEIT